MGVNLWHVRVYFGLLGVYFGCLRVQLRSLGIVIRPLGVNFKPLGMNCRPLGRLMTQKFDFGFCDPIFGGVGVGVGDIYLKFDVF